MDGRSSPSMSDVYEELGKLYHWEKPREFFSIGSVDFDEASNWTISYRIIRRSWLLMLIIALHMAVATGFLFVGYGLFQHGDTSFAGVAILVALTALLHQFFYGLSSAYSNDINNGRSFSMETVSRAFGAAIRLLPFSLVPGVAIGGLFRKRIPLRMLLDRNGEMLFIGRYIHYMMCFVLAKQSTKPLTGRMLDAARLSVDRRHDVFDVLEGERKRYYLSIIILCIALFSREFWLVPIAAAVNIFISHVGMIWIPTVAAHYARHGGEDEKLSQGKQTVLWRAWFKTTGTIQLVAGVATIGMIGYFVTQSTDEKAIAREEYRRTLEVLPAPSDDMIGEWENPATGQFKIDRMPEMECSTSTSGFECKRTHGQNGACYDVANYLTKVCLFEGALNAGRLADSYEGRMLLALLGGAKISTGDIEFSMLSVNLDSEDGGFNLGRGGIFRLAEGSESAARHGRDVMVVQAGAYELKRAP